jgi:hypothetical protein
MIAGVGNSHFAITTSSPQAQVWFNEGLQSQLLPAALKRGAVDPCVLTLLA